MFRTSITLKSDSGAWSDATLAKIIAMAKYNDVNVFIIQNEKRMQITRESTIKSIKEYCKPD